MSTDREHNHYFKSVKGLAYIDVYMVCQLFGVTDQAIGHAVKKLLCMGKRGGKDDAKDLKEAIDSLVRAQEMRAELARAPGVEWVPGPPKTTMPAPWVPGNPDHIPVTCAACGVVSSDWNRCTVPMCPQKT